MWTAHQTLTKAILTCHQIPKYHHAGNKSYNHAKTKQKVLFYTLDCSQVHFITAYVILNISSDNGHFYVNVKFWITDVMCEGHAES